MQAAAGVALLLPHSHQAGQNVRSAQKDSVRAESTAQPFDFRLLVRRLCGVNQHGVKTTRWRLRTEALQVVLCCAYDFLLLVPADAAAGAAVMCAFSQFHFYKNQCFRVLHDKVYFGAVATSGAPVAFQAVHILLAQKRQRHVLAPFARAIAVSRWCAGVAFLRYSGLAASGRCGCVFAFVTPYPYPFPKSL